MILQIKKNSTLHFQSMFCAISFLLLGLIAWSKNAISHSVNKEMVQAF